MLYLYIFLVNNYDIYKWQIIYLKFWNKRKDTQFIDVIELFKFLDIPYQNIFTYYFKNSIKYLIEYR